MITTAKILNLDDRKMTLQLDYPLTREVIKKMISTVELRISDGREITNEQRRKTFAIIADIAKWSGHEPEYLRQMFTWDFIKRKGIEYFSLSDVDMTTSKEFISYLIDFCFINDVPTKDTLLNQTDDIGKYLYSCLEHSKCAICNKHAEVHHVDRIGMGRDREHILHEGLNAVALCREHHIQAHGNEIKLFKDNHIYGIKLDSYLCYRLNLKSKEQ